MVKTILKKIFGSRFDRELKKIQPVVDRIHEHEKRLGTLSEDELKGQTEKFRALLKEGYGALQEQVDATKAEKHGCADPVERDKLTGEIHDLEEELKREIEAALDDILPEAFATVRETCRRLLGTTLSVTGRDLEWDMVPYDVQLIGGLVLHRSRIAEMATGEGKTLVATLPLYLNALPGRGAHLVTVNNYLARRDSQWMGHVFEYLGLEVACLDDTEPSSPERRAAYAADITYGTNNEFGFDFLRDNMVFTLEQRVQRPYNYAIIDEVDSILIDEARTPLIISGPAGHEGDTKYAEHNARVKQLVRKQTAVVNGLVADATPMVDKDEPEYDGAYKLFQAQMGAPKNKKLMKLMHEPKVQQLVQRVELDSIADRKLPAKDQRFRGLEDELYFVMDERGHSVHLTDRGLEEMSPDDPALFVVPDISEEFGKIEHDESMSGEDKVILRRELEAEYASKSEKIHIIHKLLQAHALYERDVQYLIQGGQVLIVDEFTGRCMPGRRWSDGLHQAVEAKEGVTVRGETQTLATITIQNYFRMYDKLAGMTGTAETEEREFFEIYGLEVSVIPTNEPICRRDYDDVIYKTRREKYNAVIDEIAAFHEIGQPVLVGTTNVEVSETVSRMLKRRGLKHEVLNAKFHQREAEIIANAGQRGAITIATNMAGRGTDIKLGEGVTAIRASEGENGIESVGGLAIIGTERHESRRIDRQLRGRSGRQGDPGQGRFFLSLEDNLMRLFATDRIARWMDKTGAEEGEVITHPLVTRAIGNAQKRVELQNFQARKRLLDYDDVMNQQREVIYSLRLFALEGGEELKAEAQRMIEAALKRFVAGFEGEDPEEWDRQSIVAELLMRFLVSAPDVEDAKKVPDTEALAATVQRAGREAFQAKIDSWNEIEQRYGAENLTEKLLSNFMLQVLDEKWKDHLYDLDQLRNAIQYRAWGQKDPLIEYKREAFELFEDLVNDIRQVFTERFFRLQVQGPGGGTATGPRRPQPRAAQQVTESSDIDLLVPGARRPPPQQLTTSGPAKASREPARPMQRSVPKVGRNDPCPCGSGKKYKKCHGGTA
ncbi:MAG: preprotein translocase subunit SecA [Gemmatimonadetes bacterium]|nr:preprotein translocase subunit SecA [Gemmatimonadota bacterium]